MAQDRLDIRGEKIMNLKGTRTPWIAPFEKHDFEVSGKHVTIVCPEHPVPVVDFILRHTSLEQNYQMKNQPELSNSTGKNQVKSVFMSLL